MLKEGFGEFWVLVALHLVANLEGEWMRVPERDVYNQLVDLHFPSLQPQPSVWSARG